jgi:hypothetical protein
MDLLKVSAENAKEEIGKGLLDALSMLGKDNSIQNATDLMDGFGRATADVILGVGVLASKLEKLTSSRVGGALFDVRNIPVLGAFISGAREIGAGERARTAPSNKEGRASSRVYLQQLRLESKALKTATDLRKQEIATLKARSEVDKLRDKFDVERIGLMKALNEATDLETQQRILAKIAILDNNEALATKINAELEAAKKAKELADAFGNSAIALTNQIAKMQAMNDALIGKILERLAAGTLPPGTSLPPGVIDKLFPPALGPIGGVDYTVPIGSGNPVYAPGTGGTGMSYMDVKLTVDTANIGDKFSQLIAESLQIAERTGYSTTPNGAIR